MRYLLDTNACITMLNGTSQRLAAQLRRRRTNDIGLPSVVAFELYYGAFKSAKPEQNLRLLEKVPFEVISLDEADAREAGEIRSRLEARGQPIGPFDLLIAGQARCRRLTLITANTREFQRVDGLDCQDWTLSSAEGQH